MNAPSDYNDVQQSPRYLWTSAELLDPSVWAVELWLLESGKYAATKAKMLEEAHLRGIKNPALCVDLIFKPGKVSELWSPGQPYPIREDEWEQFVSDIPEYCWDKIPRVYMVDDDKYTLPI